MKLYSIVAITLIVLLVVPITAQEPAAIVGSQSPFTVSDTGLLPSQQYVWQEINGFCAWAATTMAMQYAGVDVSMYDVFAASTIGFSFAYFRFDDTLLIYPGALYTQVEPTQFLADLYGVNYTLYVGDDIPALEQNVQVWESEGIQVGVLDGQVEAFNLMRSTIDQGYPLLISVDPAYLPAYDYDFLREGGLSGGAHGILIVGYNDTEASATILDPGVGSFGEYFGYPDDGRGNYTNILYTALIDAWSNRYYISNTFLPGTPPSAPVDNQLGPMVRDKLLGVGSIYSPSSPNALVGDFGEAGFRQMSEDITVDGLKSFLSVFDGIDDETNFKASLLFFIGAGLEAQVTLQYLSYRTALESLPTLMSETDLTAFVDAGEDALPAFENLVDNSTLIFPGNLSQMTGVVATTFLKIAEAFNASGDIDTTLTPYESTLNSISADLLTIADSWRDAGNALAEIWPNDFFSTYGPVLAFAGGGVAVLVIGVIWYVSRKPSQ
ncbi:MAG: BtrH N-terminal domain-containing protein [Candidatus Thorarchaeota archaeon]